MRCYVNHRLRGPILRQFNNEGLVKNSNIINHKNHMDTSIIPEEINRDLILSYYPYLLF